MNGVKREKGVKSGREAFMLGKVSRGGEKTWKIRGQRTLLLLIAHYGRSFLLVQYGPEASPHHLNGSVWKLQKQKKKNATDVYLPYVANSEGELSLYVAKKKRQKLCVGLTAHSTVRLKWYSAITSLNYYYACEKKDHANGRNCVDRLFDSRILFIPYEMACNVYFHIRQPKSRRGRINTEASWKKKSATFKAAFSNSQSLSIILSRKRGQCPIGPGSSCSSYLPDPSLASIIILWGSTTESPVQ